MLQAVLPLCPNKPWVFITFRPHCPRDSGLAALMLAALMLAGLNYIYNIGTIYILREDITLS